MSEHWNWLLPADEVAEAGAAFIRETVEAAGLDGVVIGLSGGIDSAVSAALAVKGLGPDRVLGVTLPYRLGNPDSLADGRAVGESLGIRVENVDISPLVDAYVDDLDEGALLRRGNVMARARMIVLYDLSARDGLLVLGTGNRTETLLGYATLHGDAAFALNPLGDLYKAEVRAVARHLELPAQVIAKAPSADLWAGQTDEEELGFTYDQADQLLHLLYDEGLGDKQIAALGFAPELVDAVRARVRAQAFKWLSVPTLVFGGRPMPDLGNGD